MEKYFTLVSRGRLFSFSNSSFYKEKKTLFRFCFHEKSLSFVVVTSKIVSRFGGKFLREV
jgi:hypothetical protein